MKTIARNRNLARIVTCLAILCSAVLPAGAALAAISDCHDATCRITTPDGSTGTGCVFEIGQGQVYVLTAAHVVGRHAVVSCDFWRRGHQSQPLRGEVLARVEDQQCDAAIVAVPDGLFGGVLPRAIPVAPRGHVLSPGETVTSVGCAGGAWSTGWKGHVLSCDGPELCFVPAPANGRSGSAVFDAEGRRIVGLLRARTVDNAQGIACSLDALYAGLGAAVAARYSPRPEMRPAQCGPQGCYPDPRRYHALPYRQFQQQRDDMQNWQLHEQRREMEDLKRQQHNAWPTLPPQPSAPQYVQPSPPVPSPLPSPLPSPRDEGPSGVGVVLAVLAALATGGIIFYATQNHTPIE